MQASSQSRDCRLVLNELVERDGPIGAAEAVDLADLTWRYGISTGDSRYCALSESFRIIADQYEAFGALPADSISAAMREIRRAVPGILSAAAAADAAREAMVLAESIAGRVSE